jgi:hypothetical protein
MVVLTEEMVLNRVKAGDLSLVRNLNLWGNDITDVRTEFSDFTSFKIVWHELTLSRCETDEHSGKDACCGGPVSVVSNRRYIALSNLKHLLPPFQSQ